MAASAGATSAASKSLWTYVLITPARNEADFIEGTIRSVLAQTILPARWVIVDDGSTDATAEIVECYRRDHLWMELLQMPKHETRQFAAKAHAFNAGYATVREDSYEVIGNLDADISFDCDYVEFLLRKFAADPQLGVAGTPFIEDRSRPDQHTYAHRHAQLEHVSGACQLFRRSCFEELGGYKPIRGGAVDWIAVTTARMNGWKTRTFTDKVSFHQRKLGTGNNSPLMVKFHYGRKAYYVGGHPVWELLRGVFQMREKPYILGGLFFQAGFLWSFLSRVPRAVDDKLLKFHRMEQMSRLRRLFTK